MTDLLEKLGRLGVVPVVKIERAEDAIELVRALLAGGLPCAEITFRTTAAEDAIRLISSKPTGDHRRGGDCASQWIRLIRRSLQALDSSSLLGSIRRWWIGVCKTRYPSPPG